MDGDETEQRPSLPAANSPASTDRRALGPWVVDAEFRVLPPIWRLWRAVRDSWWALGPYLAYCTALWGLAALIGWLMDRERPG